MEGQIRKHKANNFNSWCNLHYWINDRNVRKLIYAKLNRFDFELVKIAHGKKIVLTKHPRVYLQSEYFAENGFLSCLKWHIESFQPASKLCIEFCIKNNHVNVLEWLSQTKYYNVDGLYRCGATYGSLDCLNFLWDKKYPKEYGVCTLAAKHGHLECLKWARERQFFWDAATILEALYNNQDQCLQWCIDNGAPVEETIMHFFEQPYELINVNNYKKLILMCDDELKRKYLSKSSEYLKKEIDKIKCFNF